MGRWKRGDRIAGRFVIEGRVASGGMAELYAARMELARGVERRVAIKRIHPHLSDNPEFVTMFLDEARVSSQLAHPGIVPVLDAVDDGGELLLVLELVPGWDLASVLRKGREARLLLPLGAVMHVATALAATLAYVHDARDLKGQPLTIVHRDVTPSNLLLAEDGTVRLLDFGVAKAAARVTRTATATLKGKLSYCAPEQVLGGTVTPRTDLYAVGLVIFEMATGRRAIDGGDDLACLELARRPVHVAPSRLRPEVPEPLDRLVRSLLAVSPDKRPRDARAVVDALARIEIADTGPEPLRAFVEQVMGQLSRPILAPVPGLEAALADVAGLSLANRTPAASDAKGKGAGAAPPKAGDAAERTPSTLVTASSTPGSASSMLRAQLRRRARVTAVIGAAVVLTVVAAGTLSLVDADSRDPEPSPVDRAEPAAVGFFRVTSEPSGASVRVDGERWSQPTPTIVESPAGHRRRVEVVLDDHEPFRRDLASKAGASTGVHAALARLPGSLVVRSDPPGALVVVDGTERGVTPLELHDLERRAVDVRVTLDGHTTHEERVALDRTAEHTIEAMLRRRVAYGTLNVNSQPWALVRVDGRMVAESTPALGIRLPAGNHTVTLTNPQHGTRTRRIVIRDGETTPVIVRFP